MDKLTSMLIIHSEPPKLVLTLDVRHYQLSGGGVVLDKRNGVRFDETECVRTLGTRQAPCPLGPCPQL
jgi:hypothetical protein